MGFIERIYCHKLIMKLSNSFLKGTYIEIWFLKVELFSCNLTSCRSRESSKCATSRNWHTEREGNEYKIISYILWSIHYYNSISITIWCWMLVPFIVFVVGLFGGRCFHKKKSRKRTHQDTRRKPSSEDTCFGWRKVEGSSKWIESGKRSSATAYRRSHFGEQTTAWNRKWTRREGNVINVIQNVNFA